MKYWQQQKQLLSSSSFRYYLLSSIAGTFASGLAYIVMIWMILHFHSSINATLLGMIIYWLPSLFLSPHFGAVIDYYDKKTLTLIAEFTRAVKFILFGFLFLYHPSLWAVYLLLILSGCFAALYKPLLPAFVHELVSEEQLVYANTNIHMAFEIGNIVGRGIITVVVLSLVGTFGALFIVAALYLISALTIIPVKRHHTYHSQDTGKPNFMSSIIAGYRYLFEHKSLYFYIIIDALIVMSLMAAAVLVGPYVKNVLQEGSDIFGLSEAALSLGSLVGTLFWSITSNYIAKEWCLVMTGILSSLGFLVLGHTVDVQLALIAFVGVGFSWGSYALIMTIVQMLTDKAFQGRVQAAVSFAVTVVFILFAVFLHTFDKNYSAQHAFNLLSGIMVISSLVSLFACFRRP